MKVTIIDETTAGQRFESLVLDLINGQTTAREILSERIREEIKRARVASTSRSLVQREEHSTGKIDPDAQIKIAVGAFESGRLLMLLADRQVDDLDAPINLAEGDEVTFLRLVPLIGG